MNSRIIRILRQQKKFLGLFSNTLPKSKSRNCIFALKTDAGLVGLCLRDNKSFYFSPSGEKVPKQIIEWLTKRGVSHVSHNSEKCSGDEDSYVILFCHMMLIGMPFTDFVALFSTVRKTNAYIKHFMRTRFRA